MRLMADNEIAEMRETLASMRSHPVTCGRYFDSCCPCSCGKEDAILAQSVEQLLCKQSVAGSTPADGSINCRICGAPTPNQDRVCARCSTGQFCDHALCAGPRIHLKPDGRRYCGEHEPYHRLDYLNLGGVEASV